MAPVLPQAALTVRPPRRPMGRGPPPPGPPSRPRAPGVSRQLADATVTSPVPVEAKISLVEAGFVGTSTLVSPVWV